MNEFILSTALRGNYAPFTDQEAEARSGDLNELRPPAGEQESPGLKPAPAVLFTGCGLSAANLCSSPENYQTSGG